MKTILLSDRCTGPNRNCRAAHRSGYPVHVIAEHSRSEPALIMPSNHYLSEDDGRRSIELAALTAPTVRTDADLLTYREQRVPHFLPVGWIDPTCRRS